MRLGIIDTVLREEARPVRTDDRSHLRRLGRALVDAMVGLRGAGLAAPQCGLGLRAFAIGCGVDEAFFNPVVVARSPDEVTGGEGCLSLPGETYDVPRAKWVDLEWTDVRGRRVSQRFEGVLARVVQHECDHLDGLLISRFPARAGRVPA